MDQSLRPCQLVPKGLVVEQTTLEHGFVRIWVRAASSTGICPSCGTISRRVHSRYLRRPSDSPLSGHRVSFNLTVRRFRCDTVLCGQQVFAERFADDVLGCRARRTGRMEHIVHHLGLALGGRPAASFAQRLMLPVSNDTLLRVVRRRAQVPYEPLLSSASMTSPGGATTATERLLLIWNAVDP
jgi:hypothetical protein